MPEENLGLGVEPEVVLGSSTFGRFVFVVVVFHSGIDSFVHQEL